MHTGKETVAIGKRANTLGFRVNSMPVQALAKKLELCFKVDARHACRGTNSFQVHESLYHYSICCFASSHRSKRSLICYLVANGPLPDRIPIPAHVLHLVVGLHLAVVGGLLLVQNHTDVGLAHDLHAESFDAVIFFACQQTVFLLRR